MKEYLDRFFQPLSEDEEKEILHLQEQIEDLRKHCDSVPVDPVLQNAVFTRRILSSHSLKTGGAEHLERWIEANRFVFSKIVEGLRPTLQDCVAINQILVGKIGAADFRSYDVQAKEEESQYCPTKHLAEMISIFNEKILANNELQSNPLIHACLVRFWLASLHPFEDGNGRTSNMISDWILIASGYAPMSHEESAEMNQIAIYYDGHYLRSPGYAIKATLKDVLRTYRLQTAP